MKAAMLALTLALAATDPPDARYFIGSWTCGSTPWNFAPLPGGSAWIRDVYGDPADPYGTAVFGYVPALHAWIYRDFHADGGYAELTSPGLTDGTWVWTGPYYPADGGAPLAGRITYAIVDPSHYDRTFESLEGGTYVKKGGDRCVKTP